MNGNDAKAERNLAKHGIPFDFALGVFEDDNRLVLDTTRDDDGEARFKAVGLIEGRLYTVVCTMRGEACRIISARPSNAAERQRYGDRP